MLAPNVHGVQIVREPVQEGVSDQLAEEEGQRKEDDSWDAQGIPDGDAPRLHRAHTNLLDAINYQQALPFAPSLLQNIVMNDMTMQCKRMTRAEHAPASAEPSYPRGRLTGESED